MTQLPNKREILQGILDEIESHWWIKKPSPADPSDIEFACIFQKQAENKEATAWIPNELFQYNELDRIRELVLNAIRNAKIVS